MATRIDIELTSRRDDATFTWRAAGAREPKGVADASLFPADASVGSEYKVEADFELEGITVTAVIPEKESKPDPFQTLELLSSDDEPLVTQQLAKKPRRDDRAKGRGRKRDGGRSRDGDARGQQDRDRRPAKPKLPPKPKAPRLRPGRVHRNALLDGLPEEQKPVAQELIGGGMQAVRNALSKQNDQRRTEGQEPIDEGPILSLAESLLAKVRIAEWRDRAEAALSQAQDVDLRDLRSVVTAADNTTKDEETQSLAASLRTALNERLDAEHHAWIDEIVELLDDERVVRALHRSSRPPKAGAPLPAAVAMRLVEATNAALNRDVSPDRWAYTLEALAHSPVRRQVVPASLPTDVTGELKATIARFGTRLPELAEIFGIEPDPSAGKGERRRRKPKKKAKGDKPRSGRPAGGDSAPDEATAAEPDTAESKPAEATVDAPVADESKPQDAALDSVDADEPNPEEAAVDAPVAEEPKPEEATAAEPAPAVDTDVDDAPTAAPSSDEELAPEGPATD